jgi:hypothetical protein
LRAARRPRSEAWAGVPRDERESISWRLNAT